MRQKERIMIYPYDAEVTPIIRHKKLLDKYEIVKVISPSGWSLSGKDSGFADKGPNTGINVFDCFEESLSQVDTVLFSESSKLISDKGLLLRKVEQATKAKKNIIIAAKLALEVEMSIENFCKAEGVRFENIKADTIDTCQIISQNALSLSRIETPVIYVIGLSEKTQKFEIQLALREKMLDAGYKVSQIGTKSYCELMDFHSFPEFMFGNSLCEPDKVMAFNKYVKKIELEENPDVIIIGIPGGIMPYDDNFSNMFGILAFEVCNAISPDAAILSLNYGDYKPAELERLSESIRYKLGVEIDCFNMANYEFDYNGSVYSKSMLFTTIDAGLVAKKKAIHSNIPLFNVLDSENSSLMVDKIIEKLVEYGNTQAV